MRNVDGGVLKEAQDLGGQEGAKTPADLGLLGGGGPAEPKARIP